ncbi:MAG: plastocyanin/azurin family copper-binding protein [Actinomycetota bacterium]
MRNRLVSALTIVVAIAAASCAADDPVGIFAGERAAGSGAVVNETEELDIDLESLEAATDTADRETTDADFGPAPIDIPDNALDLTGFDSIDIDIQDNAFVQRVVVVSAGTEIVWTNQGRNEHNVRPSIEGAFEPISTLALAAKGDSASLTFDAPGDFPYFCSLHGTATNGQTGRVIVVP